MKMAHSMMTKAAMHAAMIGTMGYEPVNRQTDRQTDTHARTHARTHAPAFNQTKQNNVKIFGTGAFVKAKG